MAVVGLFVWSHGQTPATSAGAAGVMVPPMVTMAGAAMVMMVMVVDNDWLVVFG